jgi:hypothetical protein
MSGVIRSDLPSPITADNAADAAAQPAQAEGSYRGERVVQLPSMASMIADSAEEVTFSVSEHQEKDLSKRKIEEGKKSDLIERILAIQKIEQLAYRLKDLNLNHLTRALTLLLR